MLRIMVGELGIFVDLREIRVLMVGLGFRHGGEGEIRFRIRSQLLRSGYCFIPDLERFR